MLIKEIVYDYMSKIEDKKIKRKLDQQNGILCDETEEIFKKLFGLYSGLLQENEIIAVKYVINYCIESYLNERGLANV